MLVSSSEATCLLLEFPAEPVMQPMRIKTNTVLHKRVARGTAHPCRISKLSWRRRHTLARIIVHIHQHNICSRRSAKMRADALRIEFCFQRWLRSPPTDHLLNVFKMWNSIQGQGVSFHHVNVVLPVRTVAISFTLQTAPLYSVLLENVKSSLRLRFPGKVIQLVARNYTKRNQCKPGLFHLGPASLRCETVGTTGKLSIWRVTVRDA